MNRNRLVPIVVCAAVGLYALTVTTAGIYGTTMAAFEVGWATAVSDPLFPVVLLAGLASIAFIMAARSWLLPGWWASLFWTITAFGLLSGAFAIIASHRRQMNVEARAATDRERPPFLKQRVAEESGEAEHELVPMRP